MAAALEDRVPSRAHPLAAPPLGSELLPVLGDSGAPLVGHSVSVLNDMLAWSRRRYDRFGPVSWVDALGTRLVYVLGPEPIGEVLANRDKVFSNGGGWGYFLDPFFKRGVMLLDFDEHLRDRRILQEAFTRDRLIGYLDAMNPEIDRVLSSWEPGDGFLFYDAAKQLTLNIATEVFAGGRLGADPQRIEQAFVDTVGATTAIVRANVPGGAYARGLRGRRALEEHFRAERKERYAGDGTDLFSVLCHAQSEEGERFTEDDVVNHMIFVMMAAHDTSTTTLSMMTYFMAKHPGWQDRARAESLALGKPMLDYDDLDRLPTLDLIMKESLRMCPPVGLQLRQALRDTEIAGHFVPAGSKIALGSYATHRMEPWWSDPDTFDPERFSEPRREDKSHRNAWVPFGAGVHKCIGMYFGGMEIKAVLHQLLQQYEWTVPAEYKVPMGYGTGPMPSDGLPIALHDRRTHPAPNAEVMPLRHHRGRVSRRTANRRTMPAWTDVLDPVDLP